MDSPERFGLGLPPMGLRRLCDRQERGPRSQRPGFLFFGFLTGITKGTGPEEGGCEAGQAFSPPGDGDGHSPSPPFGQAGLGSGGPLALHHHCGGGISGSRIWWERPERSSHSVAAFWSLFFQTSKADRMIDSRCASSRIRLAHWMELSGLITVII